MMKKIFKLEKTSFFFFLPFFGALYGGAHLDMVMEILIGQRPFIYFYFGLIWKKFCIRFIHGYYTVYSNSSGEMFSWYKGFLIGCVTVIYGNRVE